MRNISERFWRLAPHVGLALLLGGVSAAFLVRGSPAKSPGIPKSGRSPARFRTPREPSPQAPSDRLSSPRVSCPALPTSSRLPDPPRLDPIFTRRSPRKKHTEPPNEEVAGAMDRASATHFVETLAVALATNDPATAGAMIDVLRRMPPAILSSVVVEEQRQARDPSSIVRLRHIRRTLLGE